MENFGGGNATQVNSSPDLPLIPPTIDSSDQISIFANREICGIWPIDDLKGLVKYLCFFSFSREEIFQTTLYFTFSPLYHETITSCT